MEDATKLRKAEVEMHEDQPHGLVTRGHDIGMARPAREILDADPVSGADERCNGLPRERPRQVVHRQRWTAE